MASWLVYSSMVAASKLCSRLFSVSTSHISAPRLAFLKGYGFKDSPQAYKWHPTGSLASFWWMSRDLSRVASPAVNSVMSLLVQGIDSSCTSIGVPSQSFGTEEKAGLLSRDWLGASMAVQLLSTLR